MRVAHTSLVFACIVGLFIGGAVWGHLRVRRAEAMQRWVSEKLMPDDVLSVPPPSRLATTPRVTEPRSLTLSSRLWVRRSGVEHDGTGGEHIGYSMRIEADRLARVASFSARSVGPPLLLVERDASVEHVRSALEILEAGGFATALLGFATPMPWARELEELDIYHRYQAIPEDAHGGRDIDAVSALVRSAQPFCPALWEVFDNWHMAPPDMKSMYGAHSTIEATRSWLCVVDLEGAKALLWAIIGAQPVGGPDVSVVQLRRSLRAWPDAALWHEVLEAEGDDGEAAGGDDAAGHGVRPTFEWPER